jgi:hypothetical protein
MRKSLTIYIGLLILLIVSGVTAVLLIPDKGNESSNISDLQKEKLPDNQRDTVVTNVVNESGIGELPMPVFREDVIVYFKEMPLSLEEFASKYGGKPIFIKQDINMAAFETNPTGRTGEISQRTLDFINETSKDPSVEKAYQDGFIFTDPNKVYTLEPKITYPEDLKKQGGGYVPNEIIVGFWRMPPSPEEFASKYGATLKSIDEGLLSVTFETNDASGFIERISMDSYVRYAEPNGLVYGS